VIVGDGDAVSSMPHSTSTAAAGEHAAVPSRAAIPQRHIERLLADPSEKSCQQFDSVYGAGSAASLIAESSFGMQNSFAALSDLTVIPQKRKRSSKPPLRFGVVFDEGKAAFNLEDVEVVSDESDDEPGSEVPPPARSRSQSKRLEHLLILFEDPVRFAPGFDEKYGAASAEKSITHAKKLLEDEAGLTPQFNAVYGPGAALEVLELLRPHVTRNNSAALGAAPQANWTSLDPSINPDHVWVLMKDFESFSAKFDKVYGEGMAEKAFEQQNAMRTAAGFKVRERRHSDDFGEIVDPFAEPQEGGI